MGTTAGVDIGSEAIKGVVLKATKNGPIEIVAAGTMPIGDLTRMPESQDRSLAIGEKLKELVKSARIRAENRRIGASGGNTSIRYLQIPPVPPWRLEMLVKYEVEERSEEKEPNCSDFHIMDVPETNGQYTVIIGMCRETYANELLKLAKSSSLGEVEIDLEALALFASYYHGHGFDADKTVAVADIGAEDLTVLICKNGALYYARTVLGGGRKFTQNLADDLKLDWAEADELKKTTAEIVFDAAPAASTTGRPRMQRPAGGGTVTLPRANVVPRTGASAPAPGVQTGEPGASGSGPAARSGVAPAAGSGASAGGEEARRARLAEGAKLVSRSGIGPGAAGSQSRPGVSPSASTATAKAAGETAANSASGTAPAEGAIEMGSKAAAPTIKLSGPLDFQMLDLDSDLTQPATKPAPKPAPVAPPPAPAVPVDEFELQPNVEAKKPSPAPVSSAKDAPLTSAAPAASSAADPDIIDLDLPSEPAKITIGNSALSTASAQDALDQSLGMAPSSDDQEKRKRQITAALVREAASLCAAIENVLMNAKQQTKQGNLKLDRLYITGGGSRLKGLSEFMGRRLRVEVAQLEPLRNISLTRLAPAVADALRAEQHTLGVALGLALSDLRPGTFNFQLLPQAIKDRQEFWARGAYHYYAAGAAALALGLLVYTPYKNTDALSETLSTADAKYREARGLNDNVKKQEEQNDELRHRLKTITENIQSGDYFLTLFAELKSKNRIHDDIYLSSISTQIPYVVIAEADTPADFKPAVSTGPDSFLAQRRVYIRGFASGNGKQESTLIKQIDDFFKRLVPYPDDPDDPRNLFKDIRPIWYSKGENKKGDDLYLKEFVLEAYTAAPAKPLVKPDDKKKGVNTVGKKDASKPAPQDTAPAAPVNPAPQPVNPFAPQVPANPVQPAVPQVVPLVPPVVQPAVPVPQPAVPIPEQPIAPVQPVQPTIPIPLPLTPVPQPVPANPVVQPRAMPVLPQVTNPVPAPPRKKPVYVLPDEAPAVPKIDK